MKRYLAYLKYLLVHKWYVLVECWKLRIFWRGITHDLSKFRPSEFFSYARWFFDKDGHMRNKEGPPQEKKSFDSAWYLHVRRNDHHWAHWVLVLQRPVSYVTFCPCTMVRPEEMSRGAILEMIADWRAMARAFGEEDDSSYYVKNKGNMVMAPYTRGQVEAVLLHRRKI